MTIAQIIAIVEALIQNPALKPIEEAELAALRVDLAGKPVLLGLLNALALAAGL